jgi:hypothetical protein
MNSHTLTDCIRRRLDALARLPAAERPAWPKLWAEVDTLLSRASATPKKP